MNNRARREARARHLEKRYGTDPQTHYTDIVHPSPYSPATLVTLDSFCSVLTAVTYRNIPIPEAEALAIAHAITAHRNQPYLTVITDSQQACRLYRAGLAPQQAFPMLRCLPPGIEVPIIWTPGHDGLVGNEAHAAARDLHYRALPPTTEVTEDMTPFPILASLPAR